MSSQRLTGMELMKKHNGASHSPIDTFSMGALFGAADESVQASPSAGAVLALISLTHDLHTPISGICEKVEGLLGGGEYPQGANREALVEIKRLCLHMRSMVDDCYNFGLIEFGGTELTMDLNNLGECIHQLHAIWAVASRQKKITLEIDGDPTGPIFRFDSSKLQRIVSNLIENALKYTPSGGRVSITWEECFFERRVRAELRSGPERRRRSVGEPNAVRISVSDTGCGIAPQDQQEIFEPFVRATGKKHRGMGLGLSIARKFVNWHGGRIWVESALGSGSKFCVILPLRQWNGEHQ